MVWDIALGIVLGFALLAAAPFIIAMGMLLIGLVVEGVGNLMGKSSRLHEDMKNVTPSEVVQNKREPNLFDFSAWLKWLFTESHKGRLTRLEYLKLKVLLIFVSLVGVGLMTIAVMSESTALMVVVGVALFLLYIVIAYRSITGDIQRLHDFDASGWWVLAIIIVSMAPGIGEFISFVSLIVLLFVPGTNGPNRFGYRSNPNELAQAEDVQEPAEPQNGKGVTPTVSVTKASKPAPARKTALKKPAAKPAPVKKTPKKKAK